VGRPSGALRLTRQALRVIANREYACEATDYQIRPLGPNGPSAVPPGSSQRVSTAGASRHGSDACPRSPLQRRSRDVPSLPQNRAASQASKTTSPLAGSRSVNDSRKPNRDRAPWTDPGGSRRPAVGNNDSMPSWREIEQDAQDFALRVRRCFDAGTNKTLATLRHDGAPRINGSEIEFSSDGEVTLGMMPGSMKLLDVLRDPRVALHSPTLEPPKDDPGSGPDDAKMSGSLVEIRPPVDTPHTEARFFKLDITEMVLTYVGIPADHLVIESWHPVRGLERRTRT
jgi:hypothetical protein